MSLPDQRCLHDSGSVMAEPVRYGWSYFGYVVHHTRRGGYGWIADCGAWLDLTTEDYRKTQQTATRQPCDHCFEVKAGRRVA
jgi:hypothetical protein